MRYAVLAALLLSVGAGVSAESGPLRARFRIVGAAESTFGPYSNSGYRLELGRTPVGELIARVEIGDPGVSGSAGLPLDPARLPSDARAALGTTAPQISALAARLTSRTRTVDEAARALLAWVAANIRYADDRTAPQEPAFVVNSRSAHCVGFAELSASLLRAAGIPARTVSGIWADDRAPRPARRGAAPLGSGVYHRWIELYDPARGWYFSDPLGRLDFVSALYLPFAERPDRAPAGLRVVPLDAEGEIAAVPVGTSAGGRPIWSRALPGGAP
jgi:transglutaminase-like putative cysteine protease